MRHTVIIQLTHNARTYGMPKVPDMASLHKYGCHVMTCMIEGVELGQKGLWHGIAWVLLGHSAGEAHALIMLGHALGSSPCHLHA